MKVTIVSEETGDWTAFYINNKIKSQGHSISNYDIVSEILSALDGKEDNLFETIEISEEAMEEKLGAQFPDEWSLDGLSEEDILNHETIPINSEGKEPRPFGLRIR